MSYERFIESAEEPALPAYSDTIGADVPNSGATVAGPARGIIGWLFSVKENDSVTHLGLWDEGSNGLELGGAPYIEVRLWEAALASGVDAYSVFTELGTVRVDNSSRTVESQSDLGGWLFEELDAPILLDKNKAYMVSAYFPEQSNIEIRFSSTFPVNYEILDPNVTRDLFLADDSGTGGNAEVTGDGWVLNGAASIDDIGNAQWTGGSRYGPNIAFGLSDEVAAVPAPAAALLMTPLFAIAGFARPRRH